MNYFTHCPSCKHAIFYGYGNGYGCYLTECKYELAEYNNRVITSNRTLIEENKSRMNENKTKGGENDAERKTD